MRVINCRKGGEFECKVNWGGVGDDPESLGQQELLFVEGDDTDGTEYCMRVQ